jgi:hypothetical protein
MERLAIGVTIFDYLNVGMLDLVKTLVGIALAITASSWVLSMVKPLSIGQFLTALGIAALFAMMSFVMPFLAVGIVLMDKLIGARKMLIVVPLIFTALSLAIMISSHILSMSADMELAFILKLILFGVGLGLIVLAMLPSVLAVGIASASGVGEIALGLGVLAIPVIALAVMLSSHILSAGKYDNYPGVGWALGVGASMLGFGLAVLELGTFITASAGLGAVAILAGALAIPVVAQSIVDTDSIIRGGKYDNYPGIGWIASVGVTMTGFGLAIITLGSYIVGSLGLGGIAIWAGAKAVTTVAQAIVDTDRIIRGGKYDNYPGIGWIASVGSTMTGFGLAIITLGGYIVGTLGLGGIAIWAGKKAVSSVAQAIVDTDKIIRGGKYDSYPGAEWALSVGGLMTVFGAAVLTLGTYVVGTLGLGGVALWAGAKAVTVIAQSIVDAAWIFQGAEGAFVGGPKKEWAEGVSLAIGAFAPIYKMMMKGGIIELFVGKGPTSFEYANAIRTISQGIIDAAWFFQGSKVAFEGGPKKEWADGVGGAINAFAPVYKMLVKGGIMEAFMGKGPSIDEFKKAIISISNGIIDAAVVFSESKVGFDKGTYPSTEWAAGVGGAINAFAPVFKSLDEGTGWFTKGDEVISNIYNGITRVAEAIIEVGRKFSDNPDINWGVYPDPKWAVAVTSSVKSFMGAYISISSTDFDESQYNVVLKAARYMTQVAKRLFAHKKYFDFSINFDTASLVSYLDIYRDTKSRYDTSEKDPVISLATSLAKFAKILYTHRLAFTYKIDPDFMESMRLNINSFIRIHKAVDSYYTDVRIMKFKMFDPIQMAMKDIRKVVRGMDIKMPTNTIDRSFMKKAYAVITSFHKVHAFTAGHFGLGYSMRRGVVVKVLADIAAVTKQIGKIPVKKIPSDLLSGVLTNLRSYYVNYEYAKSKTTLFEIGGNPLKRVISGIKMVIDGFSTIKPISRGFVKNFLPDAFKSIKVYGDIVKYSHTNFSNISKTFSLKRVISGIKDLVSAFSGPGLKMNIGKNMMRDMLANVSNYLRIVNTIGKDKFISGMMKGVKASDPVTKMASGITILATALDKMSKSMSMFNKTMRSIDETKIRSFGEITKNLFSGTNTDELLKSMTGLMSMMNNSESGNKVRKSQGSNQRQDVLTGKILPVKGKMVITSGKHGNTLQQMDKLIDVILAFKQDVKRIETMIRHKNSDFSSNI